MKQKIISSCLVMMIVIVVATFNMNLSSKTDNSLNVNLDNIEAKAGWGEDLYDWYTSKVYTCETVVCFFLWQTWYSLEAKYVGEGGAVAHEWNCAGC